MENAGLATIDVSAPIANLFTRAEEGIGRNDWKFAIDSLQRIIDDPQGSLVPQVDAVGAPSSLFESARRRAIRRIASLPPEGIQAYRVLYDGKAKGLYERGVASHDATALRTVVECYALTSHGDDASDLLASWALDEGRFTEAVSLLEDLRNLLPPDADVPEAKVIAKLVTAYAALGRIKEAENLLASHVPGVTDGAAIWLPNLVRTVSGSEAAVELGDVAATGPMAGDSWPMAGGSPQRSGRMPLVVPTLVAAAPWSYSRPDAHPEFLDVLVNHGAAESFALPLEQIITDGERVFVRTKQGCIALDAEDLAPLWEAPLPEEVQPDRDRQPEDRTNPRKQSDEVAGTVAVAQGLVMTIEDYGPPDPLNVFRGLQFLRNNRALEGNTRLVARDAVTGRIRWQHGRSVDPQAPLADVDFRAAPLPVENQLWVPYVKQGDLYVAVLSAIDGEVLHTILLCSVESPPARVVRAMPPAYADGQVYVPTGHGALFAIDARDYAPRWASFYSTGAGQAHDGQPAGTGQPVGTSAIASPPIPVSGLVLLAPPDSEDLLALDAVSGAIRWTTSVEHGSYLIAADRERVWLGGRGASCHAVDDGRMLWTRDAPASPTGRVVLTGDRLCLPTTAGLTAWDAATGQVIVDNQLAYEGVPLGQLLAVKHALYSLDYSGVRKFPDMERMYPAAVASYEADPADTVAALRLARLELLRGEPQSAYDRLRAVRENDPRREHAVAEVRAEALLMLARQPGLKGAQVGDLLNEAMRIAPTAAGRMRAGLALVAYLADAERYADAVAELWSLGLSVDGQSVVPFGDAVAGLARVDIAHRLGKLLPKLNSGQWATMNAWVDGRVQSAASALSIPEETAKAAVELRAVADLASSAPAGAGSMSAGQRALLVLADWNVQRQRYETAEQQLRESLRSSSTDEWAIAVRVRLWMLYKSLGAPAERALTHVLDEFVDRFGSAILPASLVDSMEASTHDLPGQTVANWVAQVRPSDSLPPLTAESPMQLNASAAWSLTIPPAPTQPVLPRRVPTFVPRFVRFPGVHSNILDDRVVFFDGWKEAVFATGVRDKSDLWESPLTLPESFGNEGNSGRNQPPDAPERHAVMDGQTAVFATDEGLFAVGLLTGKRLWVRPCEPSDPPHEPRDLAIAARDGVIAAMPRAGRLSLMRLADGSTLWERDLRGEAVSRVELAGEVVYTCDRHMQRVHIFRRMDGSSVKRVQFRQPDPENAQISLVCTHGLLCGPDRTDQGTGLLAVHLSTGETAWKVPFDKPLATLFEPAEGYLGVGLLGGDVRIVNTTTGEVVLDRRIPSTQSVATALLHDGILLAENPLSQRNMPPSSQLTALDVATGEQLWQQSDLRALARTPMNALGSAGVAADPAAPAESGGSANSVGPIGQLCLRGGRLVAGVEYDAGAAGANAGDAGTGVRKGRAKLGLALIDIHTGKYIGPFAEVPLPETRTHIPWDIGVWPEAIIVRIPTGVYAYALERVAAEP